MNDATWFWDAALVAAGLGLLLGLAVPELIARIPEPRTPEHRPADEAGGETPAPTAGPGPEAETEPAAVVPEAEHSLPVPDAPTPKELYADVAGTPGLRWRTAVATGLAAGLMAGRVGWSAGLPLVLFLAPVGVALAVVDWRTRLLPTKVIAPSYVVVAALVVGASAVTGDWASLVRAGWGWLIAGGTFFALWFVYPKGMGYGDVRLAGVLGIALGWLGWGELLTGVYAGFLLGGFGGLLLAALRVVDRKAYPFGPFMLLGALVGVVAGPHVAAWYA